MPHNKHSITGCCLLAAFNPTTFLLPIPSYSSSRCCPSPACHISPTKSRPFEGRIGSKTSLLCPLQHITTFGSFGLWARIYSSKHVQTFQMTLTSRNQKSNKSPKNGKHHLQWNPPWPFQYPESIPTPVRVACCHLLFGGMCRSQDSSSNSCQQSIIPSYQFNMKYEYGK